MNFNQWCLTFVVLVQLFLWTLVWTLFPIWLIKILIEGLL